MRNESRLFQAGVVVLLVVFSVYFLFPFLWMAVTALKSEGEAYLYPPTLVPMAVHLENFVTSLASQPFALYAWNSTVVTVLTTVGQVLSCSLVAYGFARFEFKGKSWMFMLLLSTMMIPWDVTMIPLYMEFNYLGWINSLKPLIIPAFFGSAYYIFLLRQFLMGIHRDIENAAKIDGAGPFQTYWRIFVPIMKAPLALIAVLNVLTVWNDYLGPLIFLQDRSQYTLALGLASFKGVHETQIIPIMCITLLMILPPLAAFVFAKKSIVEGISGAIK